MNLLSLIGVIALVASAPAPPLPPQVEEAVRQQLQVAHGRVEFVGYQPKLPAGCAVLAAEVPQPLSRSGRLSVRLRGQGCEGWAWVEARVLAPAWVTLRPVAAGSSLDGAVERVEKEVRTAEVRITELFPGAIATRSLSAGRVLIEGTVRGKEAELGAFVTVRARSGALTIEQQGKRIPCAAGRDCARLASGKRVEGTWVEGRLEVELP